MCQDGGRNGLCSWEGIINEKVIVSQADDVKTGMERTAALQVDAG